MKLSIDGRKCPAQQDLCTVIPACPTKAVHYVADDRAPLGGRIVIAQDLCNECQQCVSVCCGQAFVVGE
jgi:ferredoxin